MRDAPPTASAVISFTQALEDQSAAFYKALADRFPEHEQTLNRFVRGCAKTKLQVSRTYQETVSDALETGFSFSGLDLGRHKRDWTVPEDATLKEIVETSIRLEQAAIAFYAEAAEQSGSLLATIPRAFKRAAKVRRRRQEKLQTLIE